MKRRQFLCTAAAGTICCAAPRRAFGQESPKKQAPGEDSGEKHAVRASQPAEALPEIAWSRKVPVRYQADVAVIGGGIAGVSAACAASSGAQCASSGELAIRLEILGRKAKLPRRRPTLLEKNPILLLAIETEKCYSIP